MLLILVVAAGIGVAITAGAGGEPVSTATPGTPASSSSDSACDLPAGDQSVPTTEAPEAEWELVDRIAAPTAAGIGPGVIADDGLRSCFAHSPLGALFAATNYYAQGSSPELALRNAEEHVAPGAGRDAVVAAIRSSAANGTIGGNPDVSVQFAGFQFLEYEPGRAVIDIAGRNSNGGVASFVTELVWVDGDWKLVVQDNGQPAVPSRQIPNLAGYVSWSGA
ncbi:hypothetical protein PYV02_14750 [Leifsonia sp. H3M29-4]|nr:hypothetical protein [Salinibacterium metalliresistens]